MKNEFTDAQKMAKKYPKTFEAPSLKELKAIKIGNYVKVSHSNERFWVKITKIIPKRLSGEVDNSLFFAPFKLGQIIHFGYNNVYSIMEGN